MPRCYPIKNPTQSPRPPFLFDWAGVYSVNYCANPRTGTVMEVIPVLTL